MRQAINRWLRYFFGISRTEANGVIVLIVIMILIAFIPWSINEINRGTGPDLDEQRKLDSLAAMFEDNLSQIPEVIQDQDQDQIDPVEIEYHPFDPNAASIEDFLSLGLTPELGYRIIKYRENGGVFNEKRDLKKIYGLSDEDFDRLFPYILIEKKEDKYTSRIEPEEKGKSNEIIETVLFDINIVDSSELVIINGIGGVLAGRIIKFRNSLGGFVRIDQLLEVYGLEKYAFENLIQQAFISESFIPGKIPVNNWPADSLAKHPYIDLNKAKVITAYREQHGKYQNIEDLEKILVLDKSWLNRIAPYLEF